MELLAGAAVIAGMGIALPWILLVGTGWNRLRRPPLPALLLGIALVVIVLIVQPLLQRLPFTLGHSIGGWMLLAYWALVSGLLQELLKIMTVTRKGTRPLAPAVGLGFGMGEVILVVLPQLAFVGEYKHLAGPLALLTWEAYALSGWERLNATLYHVSSATLLAVPWAGPLVRWLALGLLHAGVNLAALASVRYYGLVEPNPLLVFYAAFTLLNALLIRLATARVSRLG